MFLRQTLRAALAFALLAGGGKAAAAPAGCERVMARAFAERAVPAVYVSHVALVRGRIGGRGPYWFLLDTGASASAVDARVARDLGLQTLGADQVLGSAGAVEARTVALPELAVGGVVLRNLRPTSYDLSGSLAPPGAAIAGILGHDVFRRLAVAFDFRARTVALRRPSGLEARAAACGAALPFVLDNHIPRLRGMIDGARVSLRLDTGAGLFDTPDTYVNVASGQFEALLRREPGLKPVAYFGGAGGGGSVRLAVVPARSFRLGPLDLPRPHMIVQPRQGYFARPDAVGFMGGYVFEPLGGLIVDYPGRRVIARRKP